MTTTLTRTRGGVALTVAWILQILCAAMFLFAGGSKLAGQQANDEVLFCACGLPQKIAEPLVAHAGGAGTFEPFQLGERCVDLNERQAWRVARGKIS